MEIAYENRSFTCRACLQNSKLVFPIAKFIPEVNLTINTMLSGCSLEIDKSEELPQIFCEQCFSKLHISYKFIQTFKQTQEILKNQLEISPTKEENDTSTLDTNISDNEDYKIEYDETIEETIMIEQKNIIEESDDEFALIEKSVELTQYAENKSDEDEETETRVESTPSDNIFILSCPLCPRTFEKFQSFTVHIKKHKKPITCKPCQLFFTNPDLYIQHFGLKHRYECKLCKESFPRCDSYSKHMRKHDKALPALVCTYEDCSKSFFSKQCLKNHIKSIHSNSRAFLCNQCGADFKNYDNLRYHMKKHQGPSFLCPECGKRYFQSIHLKYHMWRHTGVRAHQCEYCDKKFSHAHILKVHLRKKHQVC